VQDAPRCSYFEGISSDGDTFSLEPSGPIRTESVVVANKTGKIIHQPPPADEVETKFNEFQNQLVENWASYSALEAGAFTLWMINWVHPFKNGNGRTARAFAYACICLKLGFVLPGSLTIIELIMRDRIEYQDALKAADLIYEGTGSPNVSMMTAMLERLLIEQLSSIAE
jgi:Fic family protein